MNDRQLEQALRDHTAGVEADPPAWDAIVGRAAAARRRRRLATRLSAGAGALVAVALLAVGLTAVARGGDGGTNLRVADEGRSGVGPTTPAVPTSAPPPPRATVVDPPDPAAAVGIWPFVSGAEVDAYQRSGSTSYDDPVEVARAFATEYLGMTRPVVSDQAVTTGRYTATATVRPNERATATTTVALLRLRTTGVWTVTGAATPSISVDRPEANPAATPLVASPLQVSGRAQAFEGTVAVEVRADGMTSGQALGTGFVTGRGDALGPFTGTIAWEPTRASAGAVVFMERSAEDGAPVVATVVRVRFRAP